MNSSEVSFLNVCCQTTMKVLRPSNEIRFVDILAAYRTQPQFNREVQSDQDFSGKKVISGLPNGATTKFNLWRFDQVLQYYFRAQNRSICPTIFQYRPVAKFSC